MEIYLVGGAVRDRLLGQPVKERDWVVVGATPDTLTARGFKPVGREFPVFLHPETGEEYALARTERKKGRGYKGFEVHAAPDVTLEQDLARRDLTVNAMAESPDGTLVDPFGGRDDLQARVLRHVSPAFVEDPLRVLRVARFAARLADMDFTIADDTMRLMRHMAASGELDALVPERVWTEVARALSGPRPARFFEVLREAGALASVMPEVDRLFGVPQRADHHPEVDTGIHTLLVLDQAAVLSSQPEVRFAALVHDLGKADTPADQLPRHVGHEHRGLKRVRGLCRRLKVPNAYRDLGLVVTRYHTRCHLAMELKPAKLLDLLEGLDALRRPERLEQTVAACHADRRGRPGHETDPYPQGDYLHAARTVILDVAARDVLADGFQGAAVGRELRRRRLAALRRWRRQRVEALSGIATAGGADHSD